MGAEEVYALLKKYINDHGGGGSFEAKITTSAVLSLTAAGWNSTTMQQTVTFAHDTSKRNVIDVTPADVPAWGASGVYAVSETASDITFECSSVPAGALTFKVTSMEVEYDS